MRAQERWAARTEAKLGALVVFRPTTGLVCSLLWTVAATGWITLALGDGALAALRQVPLFVLLSTLVYATCWRPLVAVRPGSVLIRNVVRDVEIPWAAIAEVTTRYALTLTITDGRTISAWAAPAPSRFSTARVTRADVKAVAWDEPEGPVGHISIPASATERGDSGAAAALIRRGRQQHLNGQPTTRAADIRPPACTTDTRPRATRESGLGAVADAGAGAGDPAPTVRWATPVIGVFIVALVVTLLLAAVG